MELRHILISMVGAGVTTASLLVGGSAAFASDAPPPSPAASSPAESGLSTYGNTPSRFTTYSVINKSYVSNYVNRSTLIARCYANGGSCVISAGRSSSIDISLSLGASRGDVSAGLGVSSSSAVSLSIGCTSPTLTSGRSWSAYAVGRKYTYQIKAVNAGPGGPPVTTVSGSLTAFVAYNNQIYCT